MGYIFLTPFTSFKHHNLPEYCCYPFIITAHPSSDGYTETSKWKGCAAGQGDEEQRRKCAKRFKREC